MGTGVYLGQIAWVTGGTQGLGEAVARLLAGEGAAGLALAGRSVPRGHSVAASLSDGGCPTVFVETDLADAAEVTRFAQMAADRFGQVDGVVNAAGTTERGSLADTSIDLWDRVMAVNVRAPFLLTQAASELMRRRGAGGSIVNVGSVCGHGGPPHLLPYSVSKGALEVLTRNTAYALMASRIRVNTIHLGWMDTPAEEVIQRGDGAPSDWRERAAASLPFGRLISPAEAARAIVFLLSDQSGLMTGATLDFDQSVIGAGDAPRPFRRSTGEP